jgi:hypothetical protein
MPAHPTSPQAEPCLPLKPCCCSLVCALQEAHVEDLPLEGLREAASSSGAGWAYHLAIPAPVGAGETTPADCRAHGGGGGARLRVSASLQVAVGAQPPHGHPAGVVTFMQSADLSGAQ